MEMTGMDAIREGFLNLTGLPLKRARKFPEGKTPISRRKKLPSFLQRGDDKSGDCLIYPG
jgi:hypothetical protein